MVLKAILATLRIRVLPAVDSKCVRVSGKIPSIFGSQWSFSILVLSVSEFFQFAESH